MNYCTFTGRLTSNAELHQTPNGYDVLSFSIANNEGWGDKEHTNFIDCNLWGKRAISLEPHLTKGLKVLVSGRLRMSTSEKDGQKRNFYALNVGDLEFMSNRKKDQNQQSVEQTIANAGATNVTESAEPVKF